MNWQSDYEGFLDLFADIGRGFKQLYPARNSFHLDFEYKKDVNLGLVVKQVREIPSPDTTNEVTTFLVDEATSYCVAQAEFGDVFANHRLKSLWTLHTISGRLSGSNLTQTIYRAGTLEYLSGTNRQLLTGAVASWPNASNALDQTRTIDYWTTGSGPERRDWQLETELISTVTGAYPPVMTQQDLRKTVTVTYARPVPTMDFMGQPATTTNETILLQPCPQLNPGAILRQRAFTPSDKTRPNVTIETSYYWPSPPRGIVAGYTAPLVRFVETRITGLTTNPVVLHGYYSQTYRPGHHNFSEEFIFEPRLEPGLPQATLNELNAANIQFLHVQWNSGGESIFTVLGLDGMFRPL
jgi:hypothetical protein